LIELLCLLFQVAPSHISTSKHTSKAQKEKYSKNINSKGEKTSKNQIQKRDFKKRLPSEEINEKTELKMVRNLNLL